MNEINKVGIILVNFKQYEMTIECLKSIFCSEYSNFEVVLVDNSCTHSEASKIEKIFSDSNLTVLKFDQNIGYTSGINHGLKYLYEKSHPDYIMILNNDTILDKNAINAFIESLKRNQNKAIVTGKVYYFDEKNKIQTAGENYKDRSMRDSVVIGLGEYDNGQYDREEVRDMIDDVFWMFPIKLYETIGGYDETFFIYAEQADFAMRAKNNGFKLIYTPDAKIWHKESQSTGGTEINNINPIKIFWRIKNRLIFYYKYSPNLSFLIYFLEFLGWSLIKLVINYFGYLINKNKRYINNYAQVRASLSFVKWFFDRNSDGSFNPFLAKLQNNKLHEKKLS